MVLGAAQRVNKVSSTNQHSTHLVAAFGRRLASGPTQQQAVAAAATAAASVAGSAMALQHPHSWLAALHSWERGGLGPRVHCVAAGVVLLS